MSRLKWNHKSILGHKVQVETSERHPTVEGLRLRLYPTGKKSWQWARMVDGKPYRKALGRFPAIGLPEAQALAEELNSKAEMGLDPLAEPEPEEGPKRATFQDAWDRYHADCERRGVATTRLRQRQAERYLLPTLGPKFLRDITPDDVRAVSNLPRLQNKNGKGTAASNKVLDLLKTVLKFALDNGYDDLVRNMALPVKPLPLISEPPRVLTMRETALLIMAAREYDRRNAEKVRSRLAKHPTEVIGFKNSKSAGHTCWADVMTILVMNGNRKAEVYEAMGDEWDSVAKVWRIRAERYKTRVECTLPVGPTSAAIFDRRAEKGKWIIPAQTGIRKGSGDQPLIEILRAIMEEMGGEPIQVWTPHAIRYGFRSNIVDECGVDSEVAERIIHPHRKGSRDQHYHPNRFGKMKEALVLWDARVNEEIRAVMGLTLTA
ncbi:tyrosine-type recombinase/integrase [Tsuneonella sp. HG094]